MGTKPKKKRPMKSRRSGVKSLELVKSNLSILKKLAALLIVIVLFASCIPVRYVDVHSKRNYYQRHRSAGGGGPTWVPGIGVVLETHIIPSRQSRRGKH